MLNGFIGAMVGGFELACWLVTGVGAVVKAAVGQRPAEPFVKEQEEQGHLDAFLRRCGTDGLQTLRWRGMDSNFSSGASGEADAILPVKDRPR